MSKRTALVLTTLAFAAGLLACESVHRFHPTPPAPAGTPACTVVIVHDPDLERPAKGVSDGRTHTFSYRDREAAGRAADKTFAAAIREVDAAMKP
jgi:hypothetical protein